MKITKSASASWSGGIKTGGGTISTESEALAETPYGFRQRFEGDKGTNPEELAGAALAGCFTMALSKTLEDAGSVATRLETKAQVTLEKTGDGFSITSIHLTLQGQVPGLDRARFRELAQKAKDGCPVSKLYKGTTITLEAMLETSV